MLNIIKYRLIEHSSSHHKHITPPDPNIRMDRYTVLSIREDQIKLL